MVYLSVLVSVRHAGIVLKRLDRSSSEIGGILDTLLYNFKALGNNLRTI